MKAKTKDRKVKDTQRKSRILAAWLPAVLNRIIGLYIFSYEALIFLLSVRLISKTFPFKRLKAFLIVSDRFRNEIGIYTIRKFLLLLILVFVRLYIECLATFMLRDKLYFTAEFSC